MKINKLISLKNTAWTPGVSRNVCFPAATTRSSLLRSKVCGIHHIGKPWWNMFKNRKNQVSISSPGGKKQLSEWKISRYSRPEVFHQKGFLKILQNSQESTCTGVFFKLFSCEFCEFFKNTYFVKQKWTVAL